MRTGYTISALGHAALLALTFYVLHAAHSFAPVESVAAEVISERDFSALVNGMKTAKQVEKPLPVVDKIGEPREVLKDPVAKISPRPEIQPNEAAPPPPPPEVKQAEAKPPQ